MLALALCAAASCPAALARGGVHVVVAGDTLYELARRYGTTVHALVATNHLPDTLLRVGATLTLPPDATPEGYRTLAARPGESLAALATRVGLALGTLRSANPGLDPAADLGAAAVLVPPADGVTVLVGAGDTLLGLSLGAGVSPAEVARLNGLGPDLALPVGGRLLLPVPLGDGGGAAAAAVAGAAPAMEPAPRAAPSATLVAGAAPSGAAPSGAASSTAASSTAAPLAAASPGAGALPPAAPADARARLRRLQAAALRQGLAGLPQLRLDSASFAAPLLGRITSRFGWRALSVDGNHYHAGVDLAAGVGSAVVAARDGVVVKASWGGSYGNVVYLDHGDGSQTRYAHLSAFDVGVGQALRQGDVLGRVGSTGASTGPHLHFELRFDGRAVDPLDYLASGAP